MRQELEGLQRKRTAPVAQVRWAKLILLLDQGASRGAIMDELGCDSRFIATWKARFSEERLAGLYGRHSGRAPRRNLPRPEARVLDHTLKRKPRDGSAHWSSRKLAAELRISFMDLQRIWRRHELRPHRLDRHMVSNDPDFEAKAADVIGPYLSPPARAAAFCVDEKRAIQALDRKDKLLPLSLGRAESHGFKYKCNGTLSLFAALNTAIGEVLGKRSRSELRSYGPPEERPMTELAQPRPGRSAGLVAMMDALRGHQRCIFRCRYGARTQGEQPT